MLACFIDSKTSLDLCLWKFVLLEHSAVSTTKDSIFVLSDFSPEGIWLFHVD